MHELEQQKRIFKVHSRVCGKAQGLKTDLMNKLSLDYGVLKTQGQRAHPAPRPWFPILLPNKENRAPRRNSSSRIGTGNTQDEPWASCRGRNQAGLRANPNRDGQCLRCAERDTLNLWLHKPAMNLQKQASSSKSLSIPSPGAVSQHQDHWQVGGDAWGVLSCVLQDT